MGQFTTQVQKIKFLSVHQLTITHIDVRSDVLEGVVVDVVVAAPFAPLVAGTAGPLMQNQLRSVSFNFNAFFGL